MACCWCRVVLARAVSCWPAGAGSVPCRGLPGSAGAFSSRVREFALVHCCSARDAAARYCSVVSSAANYGLPDGRNARIFSGPCAKAAPPDTGNPAGHPRSCRAGGHRRPRRSRPGRCPGRAGRACRPRSSGPHPAFFRSESGPVLLVRVPSGPPPRGAVPRPGHDRGAGALVPVISRGQRRNDRIARALPRSAVHRVPVSAGTRTSRPASQPANRYPRRAGEFPAAAP